MVGIDPESDGLKRAREMGIKTTAEGVDGLLPHMQGRRRADRLRRHQRLRARRELRKLNALGVMMIDLTPAAIGPFCVPPVNLREHVGKREMNVNMVTCGGQATIPMVARRQPRAAGGLWRDRRHRVQQIGRPRHAQEHRRIHPHHAGAVEKVGGAKKGKAIIIINPAEPPLIMRDTVHCLTEDQPDQAAITESIHAMIKEVQKYVPGYKLVNGPVFDGKRVSVFLEVEGLGDYLPKYAGNLDIMTAAAARTAEMFAEEILAGALTLEPVAA
jgi:acetaldehyde/propanal dehydrogenase